MEYIDRNNSIKRFITRFLVILLVLFYCLTTMNYAVSIAYADDYGDQFVHITATGKKYHCAGCQYLWNSDIVVTLYEAAVLKKLEPCSKCNPPVLPDYSYSTDDNNSSSNSNNSYQPDVSTYMANSNENTDSLNSMVQDVVDINEEEAENATVIVNYVEYGYVYHRAGCPKIGTLKGTKTISLKNANLKGLQPCSLCSPPILGEPSEHDRDRYNDGSTHTSANISSSSETKTKAVHSNSANSNTGSEYSGIKKSNSSESGSIGPILGILGYEGLWIGGYFYLTWKNKRKKTDTK